MKPLIQFTLFYILGISIGNYIDIPFPIIYILVALFFVFSSLFFIKKLPVPTHIFLILSIILIGMLFHELHSKFLYSNFLTKYLDHEVILIGDIAQPVEISENKISLIIHADKVIDNKIVQKVNELVLVNIKNNCIALESFKYGDRIKVIGKLKMPSGMRNPGGFDYQKYLARKKVFTIIWIQDKRKIVKLGSGEFNPIFMVAYKIRDKVSNIISNTLSDKSFASASFLEGILLGKRSMLPEEVKGWFEDTGTIHILAISGLNVGLIGLIFFFIFHKLVRLPQKTSSVLTLLVLIIFAIMTGATPSVVRATIMAATIIAGMVIERDTDIYNNLALAALIILLQNPLALFDIGFQLSFVTVFSLIYFTPFIEPKLWFFPKYLATLVATSIAVQIGISPILIFYFNKLSLVTVLANVVVVPLSGIILILGLAMFFVGIIFMPIANLIGIINFYIITGLLLSVSFFAHFPYAYIHLPTLSFSIISSYYLCLWALSKHEKIGTPKVVIGILILINIFLWTEVIKTNSGIMKVTFLDVGQGDAIFLEFPQGGNMLIDGGPGGYFDTGKRFILPFLRHKGITALHTVIISHHDFDHYGGLLSVLQNFKIKKLVVDNGVERQKLSQIIKEKNICHEVVRRGDEIVGYPKTKIYILHPSTNMDKHSSNNNSVVVKIVYNKISFLFTGDIENKPETRLLPFKDILSSTVLKVPHHGGKNSYYPKFINLVNPKIGVIEVGRNNQFNLPDKQVLKNYEKRGTKIYRTDKHGAVIVSTNGEKTWVKTMVREL
ncbi:MAG: DNA internalization-related competence protein ComEC/Rec2 [bacterium]